MRVGVPVWLTRHDPRTGDGKVWMSTLAELSGRVDLEPWDPAARTPRLRLRASRPPDVWLTSGHHAPLPPETAPLAIQMHEAPWFDPEHRRFQREDFIEPMARLGAESCERAAVIVTAAESARREIEDAYPVARGKVRIAPHGVDLERFNPAVPGGAEVAGTKRPYVLFVSAVHPRKNVEALRAAFEILVARGLPHALVIAGPSAQDRPDLGDYEAAVTAELPGEPGRVLRVPSPGDNELVALLAGAAAFCLPSLAEGFGLTALEAMACATPVVVSDRAALPEIVDDAGLVVEPTADALAAALESVLADPARAEALARAGRERASRYPWSRTADGWLAALEEAAQ